MKIEKQSCGLCFGIASPEGNIVDSNILDLMKFLIVNMATGALENSTVCDGCLNKIIETCQYKRRNSKMLMETKKEIDSEKPMCQKCGKVCEQGDTFSLVDCVTQIDWSDFVDYLFTGQDSQSLKCFQICYCCRLSVSNIQDFLKLIYVYDQNKMKCEINNHDDIKATGNKNVVEDKAEIKKLENFIVDNNTKIDNLIKDNQAGIGDSNYISYADFKCKNEEIDLKLEYDSDDYQSTDRYEKVDVEEMRSSGASNKNSANNEEEELRVSSQGCSSILIYDLNIHNKILNNHLLRNHKCSGNCVTSSYATTVKTDMLRHKVKHGVNYKCHNCIYETTHKSNIIRHIKSHNNIRDFKCTLCSKKFASKEHLHDHLLKVHKNKDNITSKIHDCKLCSYKTIKRTDMLKHKLTHGLKIEGLEKYKCHNCIYETHNKYHIIRHIKTHNNIRDFNCILCAKNFTRRRYLDDHLLKVHKSKDYVTSKIHECDKCSYKSIKNIDLLKHKLTHGIKVKELEKHKCHNCIYETHNKNHLIRHIKTHNNIRDFNCTLCSKKFTSKKHLHDHLLKVHKSKDNVTSKIHECELCTYKTTKKIDLLKHKLTHGIKVEGLKKYKCLSCIYETYDKNNFNKHVKVHKNLHDFQCTLCSRKFSCRKSLDDHLIKIHNNKDNVTSKIHECDKCSYETTNKTCLFKHILKHGGKVEGFEKHNCQFCNYETYIKSSLIRHIKRHENI